MHPKLYSLIDRRPKKHLLWKSTWSIESSETTPGTQAQLHTKRPGQPSTCLLGNQTNEITHIRFVHQHVDPLEARTVGVSCISKTFQDVLKPPSSAKLMAKNG